MIERVLRAALLPALILAVLVSGVFTVHTRHEARKLFVQLQDMEKQRDELEIEWGKLRLEQSTWASLGRVENMARADLGMTDPSLAEVMAIESSKQ